MRGLKAFIGATALGMFGIVGTSSALVFDDAEFLFDASGSGTNWTFTAFFDFTNTDSGQFYQDFIESWSFTAPERISSVTLLSVTPGDFNDWNEQGTSQSNAYGCSSTANNPAVCVDFGTVNVIDPHTSPEYQVLTGSTYTWVVNVIFEQAVTAWDFGNFHLLTVYERCNNGTGCDWRKGGGLISEGVNVPEPATLGLFGLGLLGLGLGFGRRRKI